MSGRARYDVINRAYRITATGAVLSEAHSIYGLVLTLLSGSILYEIGFTIVTWASLWWVWKRFKQSLASLPTRVDPTGAGFLPCLAHRDSKRSVSCWFRRRDFFVSLLD